MKRELDSTTEAFAKRIVKRGKELAEAFQKARSRDEKLAIQAEMRKLTGDAVSRAALQYEAERVERLRAGTVRR
jgi:hypothetical protein